MDDESDEIAAQADIERFCASLEASMPVKLRKAEDRVRLLRDQRVVIAKAAAEGAKRYHEGSATMGEVGRLQADVEEIDRKIREARNELEKERAADIGRVGDLISPIKESAGKALRVAAKSLAIHQEMLSKIELAAQRIGAQVPRFSHAIPVRGLSQLADQFGAPK